jgi:iron complex outermembrane recepter protein
MNYTYSVTRTPHSASRRVAAPTWAALALILFGTSAPLHAQAVAAPAASSAAKEEPIKMEAFLSTGTRFNDRTVVQSPVPIDVVTQAEMQQTGYNETAQMLEALVPSFNFPRPSLTDGTDHIRPATLRGLAPDQTLVLVNGKRRHTSALVNVNGAVGRGAVSVDFNAIPSSAIGTVEVLRDGASAQYGSDAIAGVINVILAKTKGWVFDASYGVTGEGDGRDLKLSASAGAPLSNNGTFFVTVFDRDHSHTNRVALDTRQQYFGITPTGPVLPSGNVGSGTGLSPSAGTLDPREATVNRFGQRFGDPRAKQRGAFINIDLPLGGGTGVYMFGGATRHHTEGAGTWRRAGDDRTVRALWPNGFLPVIQTEVFDYSLGTGAKGKAGDWNWDLSTVFGGNDLRYSVAESANVTLGTASPRSFYAGSLRFHEWTTNFDLTNQFKIGLANPLKVAAGAEFRWDQYRISPGTPDSYRDGGVRVLDGPSAGALGAPGAQVFSGFRPSDSGTHARNTKAVYVDFENNVTEQWLVSLAGRFEDYTDFGNKTTGKLATRFEIMKALALRGSISTGFHAPHLAQQWFSSTATNFISGVPFENKTFPVTDPVARALGAQNLKPETSVNESVGVTWQPVDAFTASIDFYQIEIEDRIGLSSNFTGTPITNFLASRGLFGTTGGRYFTNAVDTRTRGLDANARYVVRMSQGSRLTFTGGLNINHAEVTKTQPTPPQLAALGITTPLFDQTEIVRLVRGQPRDTLHLSAAYDLDKWSVFARTARYGTYDYVHFASATPAQVAALSPGFTTYTLPTDPVSANSQLVQRYGARWGTDLNLTYRCSKHCSISIGADNIFDVMPEKTLASRVVNGAAFNGNDNGGSAPYLLNASPLGLNGVFYYTKLGLKF